MSLYKTILVTLEGTPTDRAIIEHIKMLARSMQSRIVLLHVATGVPAKYHRTDAAGKEIEESNAFLSRARDEFSAAGIPAEAQLAYGEPVKEIVNWVKKNGCDLVAMSTHGHHMIADLLLGDTAIRVQHSLISMTSTFGALAFAEALADPEVAEAIEKFQKAGRIYKEMRPKLVNFYQVAESLGFPCPTAPGGGAPFDAISDWMRGMQGAMTDMYRYPDKLHRMVDEFLQRTLAMLDSVPVFTKPARALMPLHRGSDGFMSLKQFEEFYWPGLKAIMMKMIDKGITPCPFLEGTWDQRLEYLLELPKGKVLAHFAYSDVKKAKDVLGGHLAIMCSVPSSILTTGTAQQVEEYVKDLLKYCSKGGGFIVANNTINEGKPECVRAMIETVKEYGAQYL